MTVQTEQLIRMLISSEASVVTAESLTGGALCSELVSVPGASAVVRGGVVAYATEAKHRVLGVDAGLLHRVGAVHADVARSMARRARELFRDEHGEVAVGVSTTGVAGPDWQDGRPPGTVFVAVSYGDEDRVRELSLSGDRGAVRAATVAEAVSLLRECLAGGTS